MEQAYIDAHNWYTKNQQKLGAYRGEWIAFTSDGVIAHDREYLKTIAQIEPGRKDFVLARVHEYDCWEPPRFRGVRFRTMKRNDWQPRTMVQINGRKIIQIEILVDSGADLSLFPKQLGLDIGLSLTQGDIVYDAMGVGGSINYVLRQVEMVVAGTILSVPVAWLQSDLDCDVLLGRAVIFDMFDVEFKQTKQEIIFRIADPKDAG
ncbi:retropepsin-like aspartic protease [Chamaesiphon sp. GL140_3_metabinner_50]|uniref:retropepsin-like aspartic protease n=1 Tax=Chamaesiphon sp. GL140_3_metabinner_50 TaxID=2970812 RepID=UPI0025F970A7|nr:retropepsin-like aspartic protease [Chamaesiphon sp. GL140_3_metabinner_50]